MYLLFRIRSVDFLTGSGKKSNKFGQDQARTFENHPLVSTYDQGSDLVEFLEME